MNKINFKNLPDETTPINATNLNTMQDNIEAEIEKKISGKSISTTLNTAGWYRVSKYNDIGVHGKAFIININTGYKNTTNMSATLNINIAHNTAKITNTSSKINYAVISKVRAVKDNEGTYIEIYYATNLENQVHVDMFEQSTYNGTRKMDMLNFEASTDSATVLDEIAIEETTVTNDNGTAIKFPDGTMIAYGTKTTSKSYGTITFPAPFSEVPNVTVSLIVSVSDNSKYIVAVNSNALSNCNFFARMNDGTSVTSEITVSWQAIGRWK